MPAPRTGPGGPPAVRETSAGGVVVDRGTAVPQAAVLLRRNRAGRLEWCLPKGHPEGEETLEQAAEREVREETGVHGRVVASLGSIDYWFSAGPQRIHKVVHHFLLDAVGGELDVHGDPDGEAEDARWVPLPDLAGALTFPNERRIARAAGDLLTRQP